MASSGSQAARRYAAALLAACNDDEVESVAQEVAAFATAAEESFDLKNILLNPTFGSEERNSTLETLMGRMKLSDRAQKFILLLVERDRQNELTSISEAFSKLVADNKNRATAVIRTASELDESTTEALKRALERRTGKQLDLTVTIDPSLIGGVRAEVGTLVFDGSIKAELAKLRESLRSV